MKKLLKRIGTVLVVLAVLVVALAIALPMLIDPNDYKDRIAAEVEARTGRELTISGDLSLTVFPWLGVRAGAMSLAQAEAFAGDTPFASFEVAEARVRLLPLLFRGEVRVGRVALEGLDLNLEVDAEGNDNWSDILEHGRTDAAPAGGRERDDFDPADLEIAGFVLADARIAYRDAQAGTSYTIEGLNLTTGEIRIGAPIEVALEASVSSGVPQWRGTVAFEGTADYRPQTKEASLVVERAEAALEGGALPVANLRMTLAARVDGDLAAERWTVAGLTVDVTARGGRLPDADLDARITGAASVDLAAQTAETNDLRFEGAGITATVTAAATGILDRFAASGRIKVAPFSPRSVLGTLGRKAPDTADPTALTHFQFGADFQATGSSATLTGMDARLDASRLTGRFGVADLDKQSLRFDLTLDSIDLDRYLPPAAPQSVDVESGALDAVRIPVATIRRLDLDGTARIGSMRAMGIASEDVVVAIKAAGGSLRVNPASAKLYGGNYTGDVSVDVRGELPRITIDERVTGVQAGPLFSDLFGESRVTGTADMSAKLSGTGETVGQIRQTLDGRVSFAFRDGAIQGLNLYHLIRDARAVLRREARPPAPERNETRFGVLTGTGVVARGIMTNNDLAAQLPFMRVGGRGKVDLAQETLDYRLRVEVLDTPGIEGGVGDGELRGHTIPVHIEGPFDELNYRVDIAEVLKEKAKEKVQDLLRGKLKKIFP